MPKRTHTLFILDIIITIDRIKRYSKKLTEGDDLRKNELLCSAVLRELGIIGEAMNNVLKSHELATHIKPYWRDIVGFRNIIIHDYAGLNYDEVYEIITSDLLILEKEIFTLLKNLWEKNMAQEAFEKTLKELEDMERAKSIKHLNRLKKALEKG